MQNALKWPQPIEQSVRKPHNALRTISRVTASKDGRGRGRVSSSYSTTQSAILKLANKW